MEVAVYADPNGVALQTSEATEDGQRLDLLMNQGQTFYIRVSGTADEVDLLLVNLVQQTSTGVTIFGTADSDVFEFRPDGSAYAASINGIGYRFTSPLLRQFRFEGGAGNDAAVITGTTQAETASFLPGGASLTRMANAEIALAVAVLDTEAILINGGGGSDSASLDDSDGDDTLRVTASSMSLSGTTRAGLSYVNTAENFAVLNSYARVVRGDTRGNDTVTFQPSPTRDQYKGYSDESRMRYGMLSRRAKFFEETYVYASPGAKDTVILYGTAGNETLNATRDLVTDRLVATLDDVKLYTKGVSDPLYTLLAFEQITARRTSGVDKAQLAAGVANVELLNGWLPE